MAKRTKKTVAQKIDRVTLQRRWFPHDAPVVPYRPVPMGHWEPAENANEPIEEMEDAYHPAHRWVPPEHDTLDYRGYLIPPEQQGRTTGRKGVKEGRSRGVVVMRQEIVSFWTNGQGVPVMYYDWSITDRDHANVFPTPRDDEHDDVKALWALLSTYPETAPRWFPRNPLIDDYDGLGHPDRDGQTHHLCRVAVAFLLSRGWTIREDVSDDSVTTSIEERLPHDCRPDTESEWYQELGQALRLYEKRVERALSDLRGHPYNHSVRYDDSAAILAVRRAVRQGDDVRRKASAKNVHVDYVAWMRETPHDRAQSPTTVDKHLTDKGRAVISALCDRKTGHVGKMPRQRGATKDGLRLTWGRSQLKGRPTDEEFQVIRDRLIDDGLCGEGTLFFGGDFVRLTVSG